MKKSDFIENYTEDYAEALADAQKQAKTCEYINPNLVEWYIEGKDINLKDMSALQLEAVLVELQNMVEHLSEFSQMVSAMHIAKQKLENVDNYEFEDTNGAE